MKSCLGSLLLLFALIALLATGGTIWYLSNTVKFSRKDQAAETPAAAAQPTSTPAVPSPAPASPFGRKQ
jgi:hypothetical protein